MASLSLSFPLFPSLSLSLLSLFLFLSFPLLSPHVLAAACLFACLSIYQFMQSLYLTDSNKNIQSTQ